MFTAWPLVYACVKGVELFSTLSVWLEQMNLRSRLRISTPGRSPASVNT